MNDRQLVSAFIEGDEAAFESLARKFFPTVYAAAIRQTGDRHLAEEITQSVFILFARKAPQLSPNILLTGWFLRTTRFVAKDALKQMHRRVKREQQAVEVAALAEETDASWPAIAPLIDEALLALSLEEQACVMARFIEGLSFREIGERQHISEDTAQKRVSRSLEKMRALLARRGITTGVASIIGLLGADLARSHAAELIANVLSTTHAALHGKAISGGSLILAEQVRRSLAWRATAKLAATIFAGLVLVGGGSLLWHRAAPNATTPRSFRVSDNRIDNLGRAWAAVMQRAAFLATFTAGRPAAADPNRAVYDQTTASVIGETTRISTKLDAVLKEGQDRERLAEFLTVELRENLGLDAPQQHEVFEQLKDRLSQGATLQDGLRAVLGAKTDIASDLQQRLSPQQRHRLEQTYGTNGWALLTFPKLVLSSSGQ